MVYRLFVFERGVPLSDTIFSLGLRVGLGPQGSVVFMDTEKGRPQVEREFSAAAAMLGLPGFVVLAVSDYAG